MHGDFYLVSMSLKLGDPKKSQEPCRVRCWNPETPSLQQQARLMLPPWQEELIESSAAQRGTLRVGVWISALVCLLRRVPQRALLLGLVWQEGGLRNLRPHPHLAAWQDQMLPRGCCFSPDSATNALCALVREAFLHARFHMRLSITKWLADVLLSVIKMMT